MSETRKKVMHNPRVGRHSYAGKQQQMVSHGYHLEPVIWLNRFQVFCFKITFLFLQLCSMRYLWNWELYVLTCMTLLSMKRREIEGAPSVTKEAKEIKRAHDNPSSAVLTSQTSKLQISEHSKICISCHFFCTLCWLKCHLQVLEQFVLVDSLS